MNKHRKKKKSRKKPAPKQTTLQVVDHPVRRRYGYALAGLLALIALGAGVSLLLNHPAASGVQLVQATTVGTPVFATGDTSSGGQGQVVDGISCDTSERTVYHVHAHLSLFVNGKQVAVPAGIGITPPIEEQNNFVDSGGCFYWLHTHDATGIIHIESPNYHTYTLGQFFAEWGQPLSKQRLFNQSGTVSAFVNNQLYTGDPRTIPLRSHEQIVLEIGGTVTPPVYIFPQELPQ